MKVTLNVKEDSELRNYIKDMIKGQVSSIVREEIKSIITKVLGEKYKEEISNITVEKILTQHIKELVKKEISNGSWSKPSYIQNIAKQEINKLVKEAFEKGRIV